MADLEIKPITRPGNDWLPGNPWLWMGLGLVSGGMAWGLVRVIPDGDGGTVRFLLVAFSVIAMGIGLNLRLRSDVLNYLEPTASSLQMPLLLLVALFYSGLALVLTVLLVLSFFGNEALGWRPGHLILMWFVLVPMSATAAGECFKRFKTGGSITKGEEGFGLLTLTAVGLYVNYWALYRPADPLEADTMRTLFAGAILATVIASPLVVISQTWRRGVITGLVCLHFGGIVTATLSVPPSPWLVGQVWTRIYRPYLEFMYLNNAYHFYAPEPGPASYLWFRLTYADKSGLHYHHWFKVPDLAEDGTPKYPVALEYQRILALTENVVAGSAPVFFANGQLAPFVQERLHAAQQGVIQGKAPAKLFVPIPDHIPLEQQRSEPQLIPKNLIKSYARHVARQQHPQDPDPASPQWKIHRVKIYKVTHLIPTPQSYISNVDIRDPENYRIYFLGEFTSEGVLVSDAKLPALDPAGKLANDPDPLLYWLLPTMREFKPMQLPLVKIQVPDRRESGRAREEMLKRGRIVALPKDTYLVPEEALELLRQLNIPFTEMTRSFQVLKSYAHKHARDPEWLYLLEERVWMSEQGLSWAKK